MYKYEIWKDGCCLHEEDGFVYYAEAKEEVEFYATEVLDYDLEDVEIFIDEY